MTNAVPTKKYHKELQKSVYVSIYVSDSLSVTKYDTNSYDNGSKYNARQRWYEYKVNTISN